MAQVLIAPAPHDNHNYLSSSSLLHTSHSHASLLSNSVDTSRSSSPSLKPHEPPPPSKTLQSSQPQPSLLRRSPSLVSSRPRTLSLNTYIPEDDDTEEEDVDEISFPSYYTGDVLGGTHDNELDEEDGFDSEPKSNAPTPDIPTPLDEGDAIATPVDDLDVKREPSRQVDYLSHDWKEEDIWSSWRHVVAQRKRFNNSSRLENASWRTWTKQKYGLKTVSPETLNWLKDCDVTWLYGPLQEAPRPRSCSEPSSRLSKAQSFLDKRPILKKRSVSEEMLQKSISSSSLVKQAAAAAQAQRNCRVPSRPTARLRRCASDFDGTTTYTDSSATATANVSSTLPSSTSSGLVSPETSHKKRIRFDNNVEQCIAVDFRGGGLDEESTPEWMQACSDDEDEDDEDDLPTIKTTSKLRSSKNSSSRSSFSSESKGIVKLPSTTLKFHQEQLNCRGHPITSAAGPLRSPALSPSPSQETLRPSRQSAHFLFDDQEDADVDWEPSRPLESLPRDNKPGRRSEMAEPREEGEETHMSQKGMRRTSSGMFMPFEEGEDDHLASSGFLGRVVDTVNTARDICYVLYNVGWRK